MGHELPRTEIGGLPEVMQLAHEVAESGQEQILTEHGAPVAVLTPLPVDRRRRRRRRANHDSLLDIIGMFDDPDGLTDVSANKHKYLDPAYRPPTE